jgi:membrane associated rhomboid family serine protease
LRPVQEQTASGRIELDYCPRCRGVFFDQGELEAVLRLEGSDAFSAHSLLLAEPPLSLTPAPLLRCPRGCRLPMSERLLPSVRPNLLAAALATGHPSELRIDLCPGCAGIWLDGGELAAVAQALRDPRLHPLLVPQPPPDFDLRPPSAWVWLFMFLTGLPVETWQPRARRPLAVIVIAVLCCALFGLQLVGPADQPLVAMFGLHPGRLWQGDWLPLVTYMFLHGGLPHLLGNLYFLWIFGDNVEDRLGSGRFLLLYLIAGVGAGLLHCLLSSEPGVPVVGASGAISGVMAAYALLFPQARLVSLILVFQVRWKTTTYLFLWLGLQVMGALLGSGQVAWWAHIGGFLIGAAQVWNQRPAAAAARLAQNAPWPPVRQPPPASSSEPPSLYWK